MKKAFFTITVLFAIIVANGCTNKEGDSDLDIITPADSTQSKVYKQEIPGG
ncbi:MAG: hypothetical protein KJN76_06410 [Eudoraea sp.]|nr:hypothetical protein [Eudoraea sp.]